MDLSLQLSVAIEAIKKASLIIKQVYNEGFTVSLKEDKSVVTKADLLSDKCIREILMEKFPTYGILTEENSSKDNNRLNDKFCWIVDPLDGTKDFVNHTNNFSINIALAYQNEIVLGVIAVPMQEVIYYATLGTGAYKILNDKVSKIHVSTRTNNLRMLTSQFFFHDEDDFKNNELIESMSPIGSSYKACLIAEGKAEFCVKFDDHTKEWDTAPSEIIVKEAGGIMKDMYGNANTYNKKDFVNHNGFIIANNKQVLDMFKK